MPDQTVRECDRCHAQTASGTRCRNRTCTTGTYCWQHLRKLEGLRVTNSTVQGAGRGLFAAKPFRAGDAIAPYRGEPLTLQQYNARYPADDGQYVLQLSANRFVDARSTQHSVARYANACDKPGDRRPCNAKFTDRTGTLKATRPIPAGREVFVRYGRDYVWH